MRTALYIRVSTDEQAREGFSIGAQKSFLQRKAAESEMTVVKEYVDDGYSAKDMRRPALQQLLKDVELRLFDVVYFWRLDRFTRKSRDFHKLSEQLQKHSVGIKSATEPIDTTSALGRFQLELSVSLAQLERETISERVFFVMEERIRKGIRNGGPAPYGYDLGETSTLVMNEAQAAIVRRIFDLYLNGKGMNSIAHLLNREGLPGPYNKAMWSSAGVKYLLENPVYTGKLRWKYVDKSSRKTGREIMVDGMHEPIIDDVTFQRVQNELSRRALGGKKFTSEFLYSSVLKCARCGSTMVGFSYTKKTKTGETRHRTYNCSGKKDYGICDMPNMRENGVSEAFIDALNLPMDKLEQFFKVRETPTDEQQKAEQVQKELEAIARRKKKWHEAFANDLITIEELRGYVEEDRLREEELKKEISKPVTKTHWTKEELLAQLQLIRDAWDYIDDDRAKKMFISEAFESISIDIAPGHRSGQGCKPKFIITDLAFRE